MLRFFDKDGTDITDELSTSKFCDSPACLGEPFCSAWGICQSPAREPEQTAQETGMELGGCDMEQQIDHIMLELSQQLESSPTHGLHQLNHRDDSSHANAQQPGGTSSQPGTSNSRFAIPMSNEEVIKARQRAVPKRTMYDTQYCIRQWEAWRDHRNREGPIVPSLLDMDSQTLSEWLTRFILEVRKINGSEYPPNTLYHLVCGIMRHVRNSKSCEIDFFKDPEFCSFRVSLDAEMKRLQSKGVGSVHKQAEPFTMEEEELLWERKILGDHSPEALLNTMIYMNGLYFALRSGEEHRQLRHNPCQIQVIERQSERSYLLYTEDISKNRPGGLKGRKLKPKVVQHYANTENPERCFVRMFKLYLSLCPPDCPDGAFYLGPLKNPTKSCWYSAVPVGRNKLAKAVAKMCEDGGIEGYKTNHSLRATAATRLYASGVDEQLVMERTGHRSLEGIRSYKRTTSNQKEAVSDILSNTKKHCAVKEEQNTSMPIAQTASVHQAQNASLPGSYIFNQCGSVTININTAK